MKKLFSLFILFISISVFSGTAIAEVKTWKALLTDKVELVTVTELSGMMKAKQRLVILDVREPNEFEAGHIKGAVNVPRGLVEFSLPRKYKSDATQFVVYCKSGARASLAVQSMQQLGYNNVKSLKGAFMAWVKAGNEYYNMHGSSKIVAFGKKEK